MDNSSVKLEKIHVRSKASTCFSKQVAFVPASSDAASIRRRRNDFRVRLNYECADCSENGGSILRHGTAGRCSSAGSVDFA